MCHTALAPEQIVKTCAKCGADLARFIPKPPPPLPVLPSQQAAPARANASGEFNLGLGILGALLGACIGIVLMYGFSLLTGFRFPLLGVSIGALTGFGGRKLFKGTDHSLGLICGGIAMVSVVATLYMIYGDFPFVSIISVIVSVSVAYRISAHS
jgi:hypothetical protein